MKYDNGKTDLSLIPPEVLVDVANVLGFGAKKYGRDNHRFDGGETEWSRTYASAQRHLHDFWSGQDIDPESGQKHITHAICQLVILATAINDGHTNMDDRFSTRLKKLSTPKKLDEMIKNSQKGMNEPIAKWGCDGTSGVDRLPDETPYPSSNYEDGIISRCGSASATVPVDRNIEGLRRALNNDS